MCYGGKWLTVGLCVLLALLSTCSARYLSSPQEAETEGAVRDSGLGDDEDLPLQRIPDQLLSRLEAGLPFYLPDDVLAGKACGVLDRVLTRSSNYLPYVLFTRRSVPFGLWSSKLWSDVTLLVYSFAFLPQ